MKSVTLVTPCVFVHNVCERDGENVPEGLSECISDYVNESGWHEEQQREKSSSTGSDRASTILKLHTEKSQNRVELCHPLCLS